MSMHSSNFLIIAKQNNENIYLIEYENKNGVGFVVDFNQGVRYADELIHSIRKKGLWVDLRCSENVAKRILEMIESLEAIEDR